MNKTKRGLMLAGGIVNVVYTAIYAPIMLISLPLAIEILSGALSFGGNVTFADVWGLLSIILLTLVFVASLIVSCFLLPNPDKSQKPKNYFKLLITLIVLNFVIFVLAIVSADIFVILISVATIALYIATLCVHKEENKVGVTVKAIEGTPNKQAMQQTPQAPSIENELRAQFQGFDISNPTDRKIFRAKELLSKQIITDDEFKEILVEILSK